MYWKQSKHKPKLTYNKKYKQNFDVKLGYREKPLYETSIEPLINSINEDCSLKKSLSLKKPFYLVSQSRK